MFFILAEIIMIDIKNYWTKRLPAKFGGYSYIFALGLPMTFITLITSDIVYEKYLAKLMKSHIGIYQKFLGLLVVLTTAGLSFFILASLYLSKPESTEWLGLVSLIPYYICWVIITGFYVYISPGLLDPHNKIEFYQVIMLAIYLLFAFIYPIYLVMVIANEEDGKGGSKVKIENIFKPEESAKVCVPFIVLFSIHLISILPKVVCQCQRKLEGCIVIGLAASFALELKRDDASKLDFEK